MCRVQMRSESQLQQLASQREFIQAIENREITCSADVKAYISRGACLERLKYHDKDTPPLHHAVRNYDLEAIKALLDTGADPNSIDHCGDSALLRCIQSLSCHLDIDIPQEEMKKVLDMVKLLGGAKKALVIDEKALFLAIQVADHRLVRELIAVGVDVNYSSQSFVETPLVYACSLPLSSLDLIQELITAGAKVNVVSEHGSKPTPLDIIIRSVKDLNMRFEIVKCLLKSGANPNKSDCDQRTPLHSAVLVNDMAVAYLLRLFGAECKPDSTGRYPLDLLMQHPDMSDDSYQALKSEFHSCLYDALPLKALAAIPIRSTILKHRIGHDESIDQLTYPDDFKKYLKLQS